MSELEKERLRILEMVAEKKITAEEGARLLEALHGGSASEAPGSGREWRRRRREERRHGVRPEPPLASIGSFVSEIGRTVATVVDESLSAVFGTMFVEVVGEVVEGADGVYELPEGAELLIQPAQQGPGVLRNFRSGDVRLLSGDDSKLVVRCEEPEPDLRLRDGTYVLYWFGGDLELAIPSTVSRLRAETFGQDVEAEELASRFELRTMGGDVELRAPRAPFHLRTMGGDIEIERLGPGIGSSQAETTGGDIELSVLSESNLEITASTVSGDIESDGAPGRVTSEERIGTRHARIVIGDGEESLKLHTTGGDVAIRGAKQ